MPHLLESPEEIEHHGPTERDIGRCWIDAELDPQWDAGGPCLLQLRKQLPVGECHVDGPRDVVELFLWCLHCPKSVDVDRAEPSLGPHAPGAIMVP